MALTKTDMFGITAAIAIGCLTGCSSSGSSPVHLIPFQRPASAGDSGTAFSVTVRDAQAQSNAAIAAAKPQVMNGSSIDVVVTGARDASSGYVDAAGTRVPLVRAADGTWHGTLQYIDESNPPPKDPALDVGMEFPSGEASVHHIPIVEMHD